MTTEQINVTLLVTNVLEALNIPYFIGGSLASATYGVYRATADVDLVADLHLDQVEPLARALSPEFYVDAESIRDAIRQRRSFNVIHLETIFKVDIFIHKERAFDQAQFERCVAQVVAIEPERTAYMASAEDTILTKLEWYRMGGHVSDRQWHDILGVLKTQGSALDQTYLHHWAKALRVADLLNRALEEAGLAKGFTA